MLQLKNINFVNLFVICNVISQGSFINAEYNLRRHQNKIRITLGDILNCPEFKLHAFDSHRLTPDEFVKIAKQKIKNWHPHPLKTYKPYVPIKSTSTEKPLIIKLTTPKEFVPATIEGGAHESYTTPITTPPYFSTLKTISSTDGKGDHIEKDMETTASYTTDHPQTISPYQFTSETTNVFYSTTISLFSTTSSTDLTIDGNSDINYGTTPNLGDLSTKIKDYFESESTTQSLNNYETTNPTTSKDNNTETPQTNSPELSTTTDGYSGIPTFEDQITTNLPDYATTELLNVNESTTPNMIDHYVTDFTDSPTTFRNYEDADSTTLSLIDAQTTNSPNIETATVFKGLESTTLRLKDASNTESYFDKESTTERLIESMTTISSVNDFESVESTTSIPTKSTTNVPDSAITTESFFDVETLTIASTTSAETLIDIETTSLPYTTTKESSLQKNSTLTNFPDFTTDGFSNIESTTARLNYFSTTNQPESTANTGGDFDLESTSITPTDVSTTNLLDIIANKGVNGVELTTPNVIDSSKELERDSTTTEWFSEIDATVPSLDNVSVSSNFTKTEDIDGMVPTTPLMITSATNAPYSTTERNSHTERITLYLKSIESTTNDLPTTSLPESTTLTKGDFDIESTSIISKDVTTTNLPDSDTNKGLNAIELTTTDFIEPSTIIALASTTTERILDIKSTSASTNVIESTTDFTLSDFDVIESTKVSWTNPSTTNLPESTTTEGYPKSRYTTITSRNPTPKNIPPYTTTDRYAINSFQESSTTLTPDLTAIDGYYEVQSTEMITKPSLVLDIRAGEVYYNIEEYIADDLTTKTPNNSQSEVNFSAPSTSIPYVNDSIISTLSTTTLSDNISRLDTTENNLPPATTSEMEFSAISAVELDKNNLQGKESIQKPKNVKSLTNLVAESFNPIKIKFSTDVKPVLDDLFL